MNLMIYLICSCPWIGAALIGLYLMNLGAVGPLISGFLIFVLSVAVLIIGTIFAPRNKK